MAIRSELVILEAEGPEDTLLQARQYVDSMASAGRSCIRWGLIAQKVLEVAYLAGDDALVTETEPDSCIAEPASGGAVAVIVPTGVGASIGGFIGDASPVVSALEAVTDRVVVHPNVVNGADFYGAGPKALYVDGYHLDRFLAGRCQLSGPRPRKIGLVLDKLDKTVISQLLNAANGSRAVHGADLVGYAVCGEKVQSKVTRLKDGHFIGEVTNPEILFREAERLKRQGAEAIAVATDVGGVSKQDWTDHYMNGGANPIGALEALISRAISFRTHLPCAHAPAFAAPFNKAFGLVDPRASAEVASGTGLPCVIAGLMRCASPVKTGGMQITDLAAILVPEGCAGGMPAVAARTFGIPIVGVRSNKCKVGVSLTSLRLPTAVSVANYPEAIAFVVSRKSGVSWASLSRPLEPIPLLPTGVRKKKR